MNEQPAYISLHQCGDKNLCAIRRLVRQGGRPGWSEPLLGAIDFLVGGKMPSLFFVLISFPRNYLSSMIYRKVKYLPFGILQCEEASLESR